MQKIQHLDFKVKYDITIQGEHYIVSEAMYHLGEYENIIFNPNDISKIRLLSSDDLNKLKKQIENTVGAMSRILWRRKRTSKLLLVKGREQ